eukprot:g24372.t1
MDIYYSMTRSMIFNSQTLIMTLDAHDCAFLSSCGKKRKLYTLNTTNRAKNILYTVHEYKIQTTDCTSSSLKQ